MIFEEAVYAQITSMAEILITVVTFPVSILSNLLVLQYEHLLLFSIFKGK